MTKLTRLSQNITWRIANCGISCFCCKRLLMKL